MSSPALTHAPGASPTVADRQGHDSRAQHDHSRRWLVLAVLSLCQLMVVLDGTIVNIALPSAQRVLGFSDADRQWVVTAYSLAFGGLLLLGGRLSDLLGRRTTLLIGLVGFAAGSALGGASGSFELLVVARAAQGVFGAILAPAALSLLTVTFSDPAERGKAFGIFGAIAGGGAAIGLLLGGVLTEYLSWSWCLYVNIPIALVGVAGTIAFIRGGRPSHRTPLDLPGTATAVVGLVALVYGFSRAESKGWSAPLTLGLIGGGVVLLVVFVLIQRTVKHPLLPLRVVLDRRRGGAYLAITLAAIGMFAVFLFLTYYLQQTLGLTPVKTGFAFLPMVFGIVTSSTMIVTRVLPRYGPRPLIVTGALLGTAGLGLMSTLEVGSRYAVHVLPALLVMGLGMGMIFGSCFNTATVGVSPSDAGVASAAVNTGQQVGGALGTALLNTIAANAAASHLAGGRPTPALVAEAAVAGETRAFLVAAGIFALIAVVSALVLPGGPNHGAKPGAPATADRGASLGASSDGSGPDGFGSDGAGSDSAGSDSSGSDGAGDHAARRAVVESPESSVDDASGAAGLVLSGTVRQHDTRPLAGAQVTLADQSGRQVGRTASDAEGGYRLVLPHGGTFLMIVAAAQLAPSASLVAVGDTSVTRDVSLTGRSAIAGRVLRHDAHTDVTAAVAGALVTLTDVTGEVVGSTRSGSDGGYTFDRLTGGSYVLTAQGEQHRPLARSVEVAESGALACDLTLSGGGRLTGTVAAASDGRPVREAVVTLVDADGQVSGSTTTDELGGYLLEDLGAGRYTLTAAGYAPVALEVTVDEDGVSSVPVVLGTATAGRSAVDHRAVERR